MRQGDHESDTIYMKRFKTNLDKLLSARGEHILCSPELAGEFYTNNLMQEVIDVEEAKFKAILFLKRSDKSRYGSF